MNLQETERLLDEAATRIRNILDKLHKDTGLSLDIDVDIEENISGVQFFVVHLSAQVVSRRYISRLDA
jgi:hypothetical protein